MKPYRKLAVTTRLLFAAALLLLLIMMIVFNIAPGFFTGLVCGLFISILVAELAFYLRKSADNTYQPKE